MQIECQEIGNGKKPWERGYDAHARLYVHVKGESIMDNLMNRRSRPSTFYRKEVLPVVLKQFGLTPEKVVWSQKAGCSCPCSPGFILKGVSRRSDFHATISAEAVTA